jgi:tetratricopeptide (TPR) repeat protein
LLDFADAAPEFDRALALSPGSARVQMGFAGFAGQLGHFDAAIKAARRAVDLDPQNANAQVTLGQVLSWARQLQRGAEPPCRPPKCCARTQTSSPSISPMSCLHPANSSRRERCVNRARYRRRAHGRHLLLALAYHGLKRDQEAQDQVAQYLALRKEGASLELAGVYAQMGNISASLQELTRAEQRRDSAFQVLRVAWVLDPIRNEPQFKAIEARMKFPQ